MLNFKQFKASQSEAALNKNSDVNEASQAGGGGGVIDALLMMIFGLFNSIGSAVVDSVNYAACDSMLSNYLDEYRSAGSTSSQKIFEQKIIIKKKEIQETLDQIEVGMQQATETHRKAVDALEGKYDEMSRNRRAALEKSFKVKEEKIAEAKEKLKIERDNIEKGGKVKWQGLKTKWESTEEEFNEKLEELRGQWKERMEKKITQEKRVIDNALALEAIKYGEEAGMPLEDLQAAHDRAKEELDAATKSQDDFLKNSEGSTEAEVLEAMKHMPSFNKLSSAQSESYVLLADLKAKYTDAYSSAQPTPATGPPAGPAGPAAPPSENYLIDYTPEFKNVSEGKPGIRQTGPANSANVESSIEYRSGFTNVLGSAPVLSEAGTGKSGKSGTNKNKPGTGKSGSNNNGNDGTATNNKGGSTGDADKKKKVVEYDENLNASQVMGLMSKAYEVQPNEKKKDFAAGIVQDIEKIKASMVEVATLALQTATEAEQNVDKIPSSIKSVFLQDGKVKENLKTAVEVSKNLYAKQLENFGKKSRGEETASESVKPESPKSGNIVTYKDYVSQRDEIKSTNESISVRNPEFITLNRYIAEIKPNLD